MAKKNRRLTPALAALILSCALAPEGARAQFSFPYDPDFAGTERRPEPPAEPPPISTRPAEGAPAPERPPGPPDWTRGAGPFLLLDRPDPARLFAAPPAASTAPARTLEDFLREFRPFKVDQKRWNRMREDAELGILPPEAIELPELAPDAVGVSLSTTAPQAAPPEIDLPTYGTSLSITGRKLVGFQFTEKQFLNDQRTTGRPRSANLVDITQQLQLRMQGKVGPKITVNVDYDDTKLNKQDISVVYQGDPNEVVQNASFGDIDLSLPATEFVSYNKQLFGIRVELKWKGLRGIFIGSRTKGATKTKQFQGNTQFITQDILDTSYVRRRHYDLTFGNPARLPLRAGSERVFLSRQSGGIQNVNETSLTVDDLTAAGSTFTGTFLQLAPGLDYTVDYVKGILTFKNNLDPQFVVGMDFVDATGQPISVQTSTKTGTSGGTGRLKLVKTFADVPIVSSTTETGFNRELKTFYSIGRSQIVRDDGRGNFFLKVLDLNRNEVGQTLNPQQKYPETIDVDFENGFFQLKSAFGKSATDPVPDPEVYAPAPLSKRLFQLEYRFRLKTFFLEPNLVLQSEVILLDGIRLQRNVDYFIDYESGFLTFFSEERIRTNSIIDASYEVAPFAGTATDSLLGTRVSYDFNQHYAIGSTLLFQTGAKPPTIPSVNELAKSLLVYEVDTQLKNIRLLPGLSATFQAEMARSVANPNLSKKALVENMEGVLQEDSAGTFDAAWQAAANPTQAPADPTAFSVSNEDVPILEINPKAPAGKQETQKVLNLNYDFTNFAVKATSEASIAYVFSPTGLDFSQKNILELTMFQSTPSLNEINLHLGGINEDADGDGLFDTEDANLDRLLQPSEDIGFLYNPAGKPNSKRYGADNGRVDSEDLNQNGRLDPADFSGDDFGYVGPNTQLFDVTSNSTRTVMDFSGWHTFQIPLNISSATLNNWLAVKQLRISVRRRAGGAETGGFRFARIAVVGNSWQRGAGGDPATGAGPKAAEKLTVSAVNNVNNPAYLPIFRASGEAQEVFNDLYGTVDELQKQSNSTNISEQALELRYSALTTGTTVFTRRTFSRAQDISQHAKLVFLLFGNADTTQGTANADKIFFLRAGSDRDFFQVEVPIAFTGWRKISVSQVDKSGDQIPDAWEVDRGPPGTVAFSTGTPSLQQVGSLIAGLYSTGAFTTAGAVWLNEIHLAEPIMRTGTAQKLQMDFSVPGWATFGGKYRLVDRNYQTPTTVVANQDNRQDTAYLTIDRLSFFPMRFDLARTITVTPNTNATGSNSNLVSLLAQGKVTTWNGAATGNFTYGAYPRVSLGHARNRTEYELLTRLDDRKSYRTGMSYGLPLQRRFLPRTVDVDYSFTRYSVAFESLAARRAPGNFNTDEFTNTYGARLAFVPWEGSSFNPNYSLTVVKEDRNDQTSGSEVRLSYPKSRNQTVGFNSNFKLLRWLNPSIGYSISSIENNVLNVSTFITPISTRVFNIGDLKTINRSANGNISLTLGLADIIPRTKLWRAFTLTNGYQLQDGDVFSNVEKELGTAMDLWIRTPLRPTNSVAQRINLTLRDTFNSTQRWSPLEAYDLPGRKAAFKTLSLTNNFLRSIQRSEVTGTPSKTISTTLPDMIASLGAVEQLLHSERWMRGGQVNFKYSLRETENVAVSLNEESALGSDLRAIVRERFDTSVSFNLRESLNKDLRTDQVTQTTGHKDATVQTTFDVRLFRLTPKVDYQQDITTLGTGVQTQNTTVITPSMLVRADMSLPRGLYLPFSKKTLTFTNRVIWTTTVSLGLRSSPVTIADNSRLFNLNTNADYEIAKNLRMTLSGAMSRLWHKFLKEEDFLSYQFGTTLTFQF